MLKHIGSSWIYNIAALVVGFVLPPLMRQALGAPLYGNWNLINGFVGYFAVLLLGVPAASVKFFTAAVAKKDTAELNRAVAACFGFYLRLGAAALMLGLIGLAWFEHVYADKFAPGSADDVRAAFLIVLTQVSVGFACQVPYGLMVAHRDYVTRNAILLMSLLGRLALTALLLKWHANLVMVAATLVICMAAEYVASVWFVRRHYPEVKLSPRPFDHAMVRSIVGFSVYALLLNIGDKISFQTDALVIGKWLTPRDPGDFDNTKMLPLALTEFVLGIAIVVMPATTRFHHEGKPEEISRMFMRWSKHTFSLALMAGLYLLVLGPRFMPAWLRDPTFDALNYGRALQVMMLGQLAYLPVRGVCAPVLMGLGIVRPQAFAFIAASVANLGLSIWWVQPYGVVGVALGTALPNAVYAAFVLVVCCRKLGISVGAWTHYVGSRTLIGCVPVLGVLWAIDRFIGARTAGIVELVVGGVVSTLAFAVVWVFYVYRNDPHSDLWAQVRGRLGNRKS